MSTNEALKMLYKECQKLEPDEATQLIIGAKTPEEQESLVIDKLALSHRREGEKWRQKRT